MLLSWYNYIILVFTLLSRVAWSMAGCSQAVIVSCKQLYLELRIFNIDLEFLRLGGKSILLPIDALVGSIFI